MKGCFIRFLRGFGTHSSESKEPCSNGDSIPGPTMIYLKIRSDILKWLRQTNTLIKKGQEKVKHLETMAFSGTTDLNCSS